MMTFAFRRTITGPLIRTAVLLAVLVAVGRVQSAVATETASAGATAKTVSPLVAQPIVDSEVNFLEIAERAGIAQSAATHPAAPIDVPFGVTPRMIIPPDVAPPRQMTRPPIARLNSTPGVLSPAAATSFAAASDSGWLPPDTNGAVGPDHLMVALNGLVRIMTRSGAVLSTTTLNDFFAGMFEQNAYDPKVFYDTAAQRWVLVACADANRGSAAFLIAASNTADPTGNWRRLSFDADPGNQVWNDYPSVGFNKDWIAVSFNMFFINGNSSHSKLFVLTKSELYSNAATGSRIFTVNDAFTMAPAQTYDNSLAPLYLLHTANGNSNGAGFLRLHQITGTPGSENLSVVGFISTPSTWHVTAGDLAPQANSTARLNTGDDRMLSVVYRNGSLWAAHNAFLPTGNPTHVAVQWWQINPLNRAVQQFGRIEDPTATFHYSHPSIAVNARNDLLLGFSRFSGASFGSAAYAFRAGTDPVNTTQPPVVFKPGISTYEKRDGSGRNRWGDYSSTVVDPANDTSFWTIQEYALGSNQWGTWWAQVIPPGSATTVSIQAVSGSASEGDANALLRLTRIGSTAAALAVNISVAGSATAGGDYAALPTSITIPAGAASADLAVSLINDTVIEADETISVAIAAGTGYSAGTPAAATITIVDNDGVVLPAVSIQATDSSAAETGDTGSLTISRTGSTAAALAVNVTVSGSATAGTDFGAIATPVNIPAGADSATVQITAIDDAALEETETVTLTVTAGAGYTIGAAAMASVTILDNDSVPSVSIAASDASAAEGGDSGEFTVSRSAASSSNLTVNLTFGGTATSGADYELLTSTVVIPAGAANVSFSVTAADDSVVDPGETVVAMIAEGPGYSLGSPGAATLTIGDNDVVVGNDDFANRSTLVALSTAGTNVNATKEAGEPSHAGNAGGRSVWWSWTSSFSGSVTISTANSNFDTVLGIYTGSAVNALTQVAADDDEGPGTTSQVTFNATADVTYHIAVDGYGGASGNIALSRSADPVTDATVSIAATDASAKEGAADPALFTITRTGDSSLAVTVNLAVSGTAVNGGDYSGIANTATIAAGATTATVSINAVDDASVEPAETVTLTISPGARYLVGAPASATATINDNDQDTGNDLFANRIEFTEQTTTGSNFNASKEPGEPNHGGAAGGRSVWWSWTATFAGPVTISTRGSDFDTLLGVYTGTAVTELTLVAGSDDDGEELTSAVNFTAATGVTYHIAVDGYSGAAGNITLSRVGDPTILPFVIIETTRATAKEGTADTGQFTVSRSGRTATALTVRVNITGTAANGIDYNTIASSITIPAGASAANIDVIPINDTLVEGEETVTVSLAPGTGYTFESAYNTGRRSSASMTILDDDLVEMSNDMFSNAAPLVGPSFTASRSSSLATKEPGEPDHAGNVGGKSVWWSWTAPQSGTVNINTSTSNFDTLLAVYTGSAVSNLTQVAANDDIPNALTSAVSFNAVAGTVYHIAVDGFGGAGGTVGLLGAMEAGSNLTITIQASDASASEAARDPGTFVIGRSGSTAAAVTVNLTLSGSAVNGGDFDPLPGTVTIPAGASSTALTVLPIDDGEIENAETITAAVAAGTGYVVGSPNSATVTIADNDALAEVTIQAADALATEAPGDLAVFRLTRAGNTSGALVVNLSLTGSATNGADYEAVPVSIALPAGSIEATITITPIEDTAVEPDESVTVALLAGSGYAVGAAGSATATIADDDTTPFVTIFADNPNASEAGVSPGSVTVMRAGNMTAALAVNVSFSGTAAAGGDYVTPPASITIPAGADSAQYTLTPIDDAAAEALETVDISIQPGTGYAIGTPAVAQIKIADDDSGSASNDAFGSAITLTGVAFNVTGGNVDATKEPGEPDHAGRPGGRSVWWSWTAPLSGAVTLHTAGSSFDTLLAVYTGSDVTGLTPRAGNDDAAGVLTSEAVFLATEGMTYWIAVDGFDGASGTISLSGALDAVGRPVNDDISQASPIFSTRRKAINTANTLAATKEAGEPDHAGNGGGRSVWWTWTAPNSKTHLLSTAGSSFDTVLALYTSFDGQTLSPVASNDDAGRSPTSRVKFRAVRGRTYWIAVDGFDGASGNVILRLYRP